MGRGIARIALLVGALAAAGVAAAAFLPSGPREVRSGLDLLSLAKIDYADREFARAEERLRQILSVQPQDRPARRLLGRVLLARGRPGDARAVFSALHREDSGDYEAVRGMAEVCAGTGEWELACLYFDRAVSLRKDDPEAWRALGAAEERKGDPWAALAAYQESLALDPSQTDLSRKMGALTLAPAPPATPSANKPRVPLPPYPKRPPLPGGRAP